MSTSEQPKETLLEKTLDDNPTLKQNLEEFRATDHGQAFDSHELFETDSEIQQSHALKDEIMEKANTLAEQNNAIVERQEQADNESFSIPGDETYSLKADGPRGITNAVDWIDCSGITAPWTKVVTTSEGTQLIHDQTGERMSVEETKKVYAEAHARFKAEGLEIPFNDVNEDAWLGAMAEEALEQPTIPVVLNGETGELQPREPKKVTVATIGAGPSLGHAFAGGMGAQVIEKVKEEVYKEPEPKVYGKGETPPQTESNAQRKKRIAAEHNARHQVDVKKVEHPYPVLSVRIKEATKEIIIDVNRVTASEINNGAKLGKYIMCTPSTAWGASRMKLLPRASRNMVGNGKALTPEFCNFIIGLLDETVAFEVRHNRLRAENAKQYRFIIEDHIWVKEGFATESSYTI